MPHNNIFLTISPPPAKHVTLFCNPLKKSKRSIKDKKKNTRFGLIQYIIVSLLNTSTKKEEFPGQKFKIKKLIKSGVGSKTLKTGKKTVTELSLGDRDNI